MLASSWLGRVTPSGVDLSLDKIGLALDIASEVMI